MARVTVEDCLSKVKDQFALVHLTTHRYRQLQRGAQPTVSSNNKRVVSALREIAAGNVSFRDDIEIVLKQNHQEQGLRSQRLMNLAQADRSTPEKL